MARASQEARRLTAVPFACSEAPRFTVIPYAYTKARLLQGITIGQADGTRFSHRTQLFRKDPGLAFASYRTLLHKVFSTQRDSHPSRRRCYEVRDSVSPQQLHSSQASSQGPYQGFFRGLLTRSSHHDSLNFLRFVEKERLVQRLLLRANTLALAFMWIMAPISAFPKGLDV